MAKPGGKRGERVASDQVISPQTVKLTFALLRVVFNGAVEDELIAVNPCTGHELPRAAAVDADLDPCWTFLTEEEIERIRTCARIPERMRNLYMFAVYSGLRQGELWGLRWGDLVLDGDRPECAARNSYVGPTKAGKVRRLPLLPMALGVLRRVHEKSADTSAAALVFPGPNGECYADGHDGWWGNRHREWANIRAGVRFHDFRHTCASHLIQGSWGRAWTLVEVRDFLGHSSIKVTERYSHPGRDHLHEAAGATTKSVDQSIDPPVDPRTTVSSAEGEGASRR